MTFTKPQDISLTQMAQWVDANAYNPQRDEQKLTEYLYHLVYTRAQQLSLFSDYDMYDDFAIYCVTKFFTRFSNAAEPPIKSVVNYLKTVIDPWRCEYVREFCSGSADLTIADFNATDFSDYLIDVASEFDYSSYRFDCFKLTDVVWKMLQKIPKKKHSSEWTNIYTSCLLTLHDRIKSAVILCDKNLAINEPELVNRIIRGLKTKPPILFHVSPEQSCYISVLVNEIVHAISVELTHTIHAKVSASSCLRNLVKAASNDEEDD